MIGGGAAAEKLHTQVKEKLKELGYSKDEVEALKSLLYFAAAKELKKKGKEFTGVDKGKLMLKYTTKKFIKDNFSKEIIEEKIEMIKNVKASKKKEEFTQAAGKRASSKKVRRASSKKVRRASSVKTKRSSSKKVKRATSMKTKRSSSKKVKRASSKKN